MLAAVRHQTIAWANVDPCICRHMAFLSHYESIKVYFTYCVMEATTRNVQQGVSVIIFRTCEAINDPIGMFVRFVSCASLEPTDGVLAIATVYAIYDYSRNGTVVLKPNAENSDSTKNLRGRNQHPEAFLCQCLWFHTGVHVTISQHVGDTFDRCHVDVKDGSRTHLAIEENVR